MDQLARTGPQFFQPVSSALSHPITPAFPAALDPFSEHDQVDLLARTEVDLFTRTLTRRERGRVESGQVRSWPATVTRLGGPFGQYSNARSTLFRSVDAATKPIGLSVIAPTTVYCEASDRTMLELVKEIYRRTILDHPIK